MSLPLRRGFSALGLVDGPLRAAGS
jgi:hypothetical protein